MNYAGLNDNAELRGSPLGSDVMKMTAQLMSKLKLIARSQTSDDGWTLCASRIFDQVFSGTPDSLILKRTEGEKHFVKLTTEARILLEWA